MTVDYRTVSEQEPKETGEFCDAVLGLAEALLSPGSLADKLGGLTAKFPVLVTGVDGIEKLGEESSDPLFWSTVGKAGGRLGHLIKAKVSAPAQPEAPVSTDAPAT